MMLAELILGFGEDLVGEAAAGAISLGMARMVGVRKREGTKIRRGFPNHEWGVVL
jgi:hypothetical protein